MIAVTLNRLIGYGPILSVSCRWDAYEEEDQRRAYADGEWQVWGQTTEGERWLGSEDSQTKALAFAERSACSWACRCKPFKPTGARMGDESKWDMCKPHTIMKTIYMPRNGYAILLRPSSLLVGM